MSHARFLLVLGSLVLLGALPLQAERRVALVIGNANYEEGPLRNTLRDASGMAAALGELGFEVVTATDANRDKMLRAINQFAEKMATADVGLFYFSGHGVQSKGVNYLVPLGYSMSSEAELEVETVSANRVLAKMDSAPTRVNIVILDCCRNDPFARGFRQTGGMGLAAMDAPKGTMIAYATAPGTVASDGEEGGFGLYTGWLLREMRKPGLTIERMFKNVRVGVTGTRPAQVPWESSSLTGEFYFSGGTGEVMTNTPRPPAGRPAPETPSRQVAGVYTGTLVFTYSPKLKMVSQRTIEVSADSGVVTMRSSDYFDTDKRRKYASQVEYLGQAGGLVFTSDSQQAVSTDYEHWATERMQLQFSADGRSATMTSSFDDNGRTVTGTGILRRK